MGADYDRSKDLVIRAQDPRSEAWVLEAEIVSCVKDIRAKWVDLARGLREWHVTKGWDLLGYATLEEWLATPEVEVSRSMFFQLTSAYEQLVIDRGVDPHELAKVDMTKIQDVLPAIRRQQASVQDALADAEALARGDLREKYRQDPLAGPAKDQPMLDAFHYEKCKSCGQKVKVLDA